MNKSGAKKAGSAKKAKVKKLKLNKETVKDLSTDGPKGGAARAGYARINCTKGISNCSDRNLKDNFTAVDARQILARLSDLPIQGWNYTTDHASVRHISPMAQDFAAAFGVGDDDTVIPLVDVAGVAFAAIQALHATVRSQEQELAAVRKELSALQTALPRAKAA